MNCGGSLKAAARRHLRAEEEAAALQEVVGADPRRLPHLARYRDEVP